jgi:hypothetical protein
MRPAQGEHMKKHFKTLGFKCREKISGTKGIIVSISFDLNGCVMGLMNRGYDKDGKRIDNQWFDTKTLEIIGEKPVMEQPDFFEVPGGRELPEFDSMTTK